MNLIREILANKTETVSNNELLMTVWFIHYQQSFFYIFRKSLWLVYYIFVEVMAFELYIALHGSTFWNSKCSCHASAYIYVWLRKLRRFSTELWIDVPQHQCIYGCIFDSHRETEYKGSSHRFACMIDMKYILKALCTRNNLKRHRAHTIGSWPNPKNGKWLQFTLSCVFGVHCHSSNPCLWRLSW